MKNSPLNEALGKKLKADRAVFGNWGRIPRVAAIVLALGFVVAVFYLI